MAATVEEGSNDVPGVRDSGRHDRAFGATGPRPPSILIQPLQPLHLPNRGRGSLSRLQHRPHRPC
eukprot:2182284-Prymnesium_polylepis.1